MQGSYLVYHLLLLMSCTSRDGRDVCLLVLCCIPRTMHSVYQVLSKYIYSRDE